MAMQNSRMTIEWPELNAVVRARFLEEMNPELCEAVRNNLPLETVQSHGVIAGGLLMAPTRIVCTLPARHFENLGEQAIGRINFSLFYLALSMKYAPIAEPLDISPIGQVLDEDIEALEQTGRRIWEHTCNLSLHKGYIRCRWGLE